jgi:hypothetical protein
MRIAAGLIQGLKLQKHQANIDDRPLKDEAIYRDVIQGIKCGNQNWMCENVKQKRRDMK